MAQLVILHEAGGQEKATVVSLKSLDSHDYMEFDLDKCSHIKDDYENVLVGSKSLKTSSSQI